jgi:hypothetical protein
MGFSDLVKLRLRRFEQPRFDASLSGVSAYDPAGTEGGYNLFDGKLIDMNGQLIKAWRSRYLSLLLSDGRYLAQEHYESARWGLYSWEDKVIWEKDIPIHHDIAVTPTGSILTFTKEVHTFKGRDVDFCVVLEFDMEGYQRQRYSTWEHLDEFQKFHRPLELDIPKIFFFPETAKRKKASPWGGHYDYYRLNSIQVLPPTELGAKDSRFRQGNWLISFRHGSMIFILDQDTKKIVWKCIDRDIKGSLEGQHAPHLLPSGRMLIFDNGRYRGYSRVIEIDPLSLDILWEYRSEGFYSLSQGCAQRLANGNTLVTESEQGRAFEITDQKKIVWQYHNPDIQNETNSQHPENFGRRQWIYRMRRYPLDFIGPRLWDGNKPSI